MRKPAASYNALFILAAAVLAAWTPCMAAARLPPRREMLFFFNPEWGLCWQYTLRSHECAVDTLTTFFAFRPLHLSTGCCNALWGIDNNCILSWLNPLLPLFKARCRPTRGGVEHDVDKRESPAGALNPSTPVGTGSPISGPVGESVSGSASVGEPPKPEGAKSSKDVPGNEPAAAPTVPLAVDQGIGPSTSGFSTPPTARGIEPVASPGVAPSSSHVEGIEPSSSSLTSSHAVAPVSPHREDEPFSNGDRGIKPSPSPLTSSHAVTPTSPHGEEEPFSNDDREIEPSPSPLTSSHAVAPTSPHGDEESFSNGDRGNGRSPSPLTSSHVAAPASSHVEEQSFSNGDQGVEPSPSPLTSSHVVAPTSSYGEEEPFSKGDRGIEPFPSPLTSSHVVAPTSSHGSEDEPHSNGDQGIKPSPSPLASSRAVAPTSFHREEKPLSNGDEGIEPSSPSPLEPIRIGDGIVPSPSPSSAPISNGDDGIIGPSSQQGDLLSSSARVPSSSRWAEGPFPNGDQEIEPSLSPLEVGLAPRSSVVPGPISSAGSEPSPYPLEQINSQEKEGGCDVHWSKRGHPRELGGRRKDSDG